MSKTPVTVYIVDDDSSVRQALARLVESAGMRAEVFGTVSDLASRASFRESSCVIADIRMPETDGLELPRLLAEQGHSLPVIFLTADDTDTEQNREAARRAGAVAFFHKPIDGKALLDAIVWAVEAASDRASDTP